MWKNVSCVLFRFKIDAFCFLLVLNSTQNPNLNNKQRDTTKGCIFGWNSSDDLWLCNFTVNFEWISDSEIMNFCKNSFFWWIEPLWILCDTYVSILNRLVVRNCQIDLMFQKMIKKSPKSTMEKNMLIL